MAWGPKIDAAQEIDFIEEVFFVVGPLDSPSVVVQCQVTVAFTDPEEGLRLDRPRTPSSTCTERLMMLAMTIWDVQPLPGLSFVLSQDDDPNRMTFTVSGVRRFRVGVQPERPGGVLAAADFSFRIGTPEFEPCGYFGKPE